MSRLAAAVTLTALLAMAGCAEPPVTGPVVLALPASGKTYEQFKVDDARCRTVAMTATGGGAGPVAQRNYDGVYAQCMIAAGDAVPSVNPPPFASPASPYPPVYDGPTVFTQ
jgi:hypothetical protein